MAIDVNKTFEVANGLRVSDNGTEGPLYTGGPTSPVGLDLPVDSFYVQNQGSGGVVLWRKYGTGTSDWTKASPMDFRQKASDASETSTTSTTTFLNKLSLTTPTLPTGDYEISWRYKYRTAAAKREFEMRIQMNSVNQVTEIFSIPRTQARAGASGFFSIDSISGAKTFTLDFKVNGSGTTAYMSNAELVFRRVA